MRTVITPGLENWFNWRNRVNIVSNPHLCLRHLTKNFLALTVMYLQYVYVCVCVCYDWPDARLSTAPPLPVEGSDVLWTFCGKNVCSELHWGAVQRKERRCVIPNIQIKGNCCCFNNIRRKKKIQESGDSAWNSPARGFNLSQGRCIF